MVHGFMFQNQLLSENRFLSLFYCSFTTVIYSPYVDTFILFTPSVIFIPFNVDDPTDLYFSDMDGTLKYM